MRCHRRQPKRGSTGFGIPVRPEVPPRTRPIPRRTCGSRLSEPDQTPTEEPRPCHRESPPRIRIRLPRCPPIQRSHARRKSRTPPPVVSSACSWLRPFASALSHTRRQSGNTNTPHEIRSLHPPGGHPGHALPVRAVSSGSSFHGPRRNSCTTRACLRTVRTERERPCSNAG